MINTIRRHSDKPDKVQEVVEFVRDSGGLEYARKDAGLTAARLCVAVSPSRSLPRGSHWLIWLLL